MGNLTFEERCRLVGIDPANIGDMLKRFPT